MDFDAVMSKLRNILSFPASMTTSMLALMAILLLMANPVHAQTGGTLYLADSDEEAESLYTVNTTTAGVTYIGSGDCEGLALSPDPSIFLYCIYDNSQLMQISTSTGGTTDVGGSPDGDRGLAYNTATGILYGSDNFNFGTIDQATGAFSALANPPNEDTEALAADPNNNLVYGLDNRDDLVVYNVGTASWSTVGTTGISDADDAGLAFDPNANILYAVDQDGILYSIDPADASTTTIGDTGLGGEPLDVGLTFLPASLTVPTMNGWGMIAFIVFAGLGATFHIKRRRTVP